ncbi:hypothetical protein H8356DRAFT_1330309 [Neocallimastix lanati (nom. inval.)]|nr:hypothetical protein H8356DRAFT_1330309 [Neocallimastix sp. JGI-2020a]
MSILGKLIKLIENLKKHVKYNTIDKMKRLYVRDPIQNNLKYNIPNIQGKYNRIIISRVHSGNNKLWIFGENYDLLSRYSHKLRWYNITLQEKGFHHINDVLDASNINGVIILNT